MNNWKRSYLNFSFASLPVAVSLILLIFACSAPEPFPIQPQIQFKSLEYSEIDGPDSLVLSFDFQDGDGDLGLPATTRFFKSPFHAYNAITDENFNPLSISATEIPDPLYQYVPRKFNPDWPLRLYADIYEDFNGLPPYNCIDYDIVHINAARTDFFGINDVSEADDLSEYSIDTILIQPNDFRYNLVVDFFRKRDGVYELLDWRYISSPFGCGESFNGRFPVLDLDNILDHTSIEGSIKYKMTSLGFRNILRKDIFRLSFYIYDLSLHKSDTVFTDDFTLDDLLVNPQ